jgi:hypothetical protein
VFLTDAAPTTTGAQFELAAQLPRTHSFFRESGAQLHDVLMAVETFRQAGVLIAHRWYDVPRGRAFVFHELSLQVQDLAALQIRPQPSEALMTIDVTPINVVKGLPRGLEFTGTMRIDGSAGCTGFGRVVFLTPTVYKSLRSRVRDAKLDATAERAVPVDLAPAELVGRIDQSNVVITRPEIESDLSCRTMVNVDVTHPVLFDHPLDHVPGMLLLEAARQTSLAATAELRGFLPERSTLTRCHAAMTSFGELDLPLDCTAVLGPTRRDHLDRPTVSLDVSLRQAGLEVARIETEVTQWV